MTNRKVVFFGRLISLGLALLLAGTFFVGATFIKDYDLLARFGGALWVFLLSLIITLPIVTPLLKWRLKG